MPFDLPVLLGISFDRLFQQVIIVYQIFLYFEVHFDLFLADLITEKFDESTLKTSSNKLILNVFAKADKFMEKLGQQYGDIEEKVER